MRSSHGSSDQAPDQSMSQCVLLTQIFCSLQCIQGALILWAFLHVSWPLCML